MAARNSHSRGRPLWRTWRISCLGRLRNTKALLSAYRANLVSVGLPFAGGLALILAASMFWRTFWMGAAAAALALILQEIAEPSLLFWTVPWEALEFVRSRKLRVNHFWLHRTQKLLRESAGCFARVDGFATREGFVLIGANLNEAQIQWASESAWRTMCQKSSTNEAAVGCKTMQFLLALWLIVGGLTVLGLWRGIDLASGVLLSVLCGAGGHLLAKPAEKLLSPWADFVASSKDKTWTNRLNGNSFAIPSFFWFKKGRVFQVRRVAQNETPSGTRT